MEYAFYDPFKMHCIITTSSFSVCMHVISVQEQKCDIRNSKGIKEFFMVTGYI